MLRLRRPLGVARRARPRLLEDPVAGIGAAAPAPLKVLHAKEACEPLHQRLPVRPTAPPVGVMLQGPPSQVQHCGGNGGGGLARVSLTSRVRLVDLEPEQSTRRLAHLRVNSCHRLEVTPIRVTSQCVPVDAASESGCQ